MRAREDNDKRETMSGKRGKRPSRWFAWHCTGGVPIAADEQQKTDKAEKTRSQFLSQASKGLWQSWWPCLEVPAACANAMQSGTGTVGSTRPGIAGVF